MLERIRMCLPSGAEVDLRMVYGVDALVAYGVPFVASHGGDLIVRLDTESRDEALMLPGATEWNPMGRGEADFVIVPGAYVATDDVLRYWIERAYEYAESLAAIESEDAHFDDEIDHFGHDDMSALSEMPPPSSRPKGGASKSPASPKAPKVVEPLAKKRAPVTPAPKAPEKKKASSPARKVVKPARKAAKPASKSAKPASKSAKPARKAVKPARKGARPAGKKSAKARPARNSGRPTAKKATKQKAAPEKATRPAVRKPSQSKVSKKK
ncbi:MAG: hypothetical protein SGI90_13805 [Candidatus Eisenbacteria bacterium]|nr:hypothetical protein [Candidatus Eisenbacteria bacterium]